MRDSRVKICYRLASSRCNRARAALGIRVVPPAITIAALGMLLAAGCAGPGTDGGGFRRLASFPDGERVPRVEVLGSLPHGLPGFDETPAIERFLYGPNTYGKTVLRNPQGIVLAGERLLVCDQGHLDVVAINPATGKSTFWCDGDHRPRCPVAICTDDARRVYIADTTFRSVLVYSPLGKFIEELSPSQAADRRFRPAAVLVHGELLYVGNLGDRWVDRFDLGRRQWLEPIVPMGGPHLLAPTGLAMTADGTLLVVDAIGGRVHRMATDGRWLQPIGRPGRAEGQFVRPKQVCVTASGLILVSDAGRQSVLVFDADGRYVTEVHGQNAAWPGWSLPMGLLAMDGAQWRAATNPSPRDKAASGGQPEVEADEAASGTDADGYVIVSDSLGGDSLTLLRIVER